MQKKQTIVMNQTIAKWQSDYQEKNLKGMELDEEIAGLLNQRMTLNTEKTNLLKRLAEQEMATKEAKQEAKEAIEEKEEAEVKMIHAQEIAATHENTMSAMRREMK